MSFKFAPCLFLDNQEFLTLSWVHEKQREALFSLFLREATIGSMTNDTLVNRSLFARFIVNLVWISTLIL